MCRATCNTGTPAPLPQQDFDSVMSRITAVLGVKTQIEVAGRFGVRQSTISDAKRRNSVPDSWLLRLLRDHNLNPLWVLTGTGAQYLVPDDAPPTTAQVLHDVEACLKTAPVAPLLRELAHRMRRPDIRVLEGAA